MKQRTQADDLKDQIKLLKKELQASEQTSSEIEQEIMELRSILYNIR